MRTFGARPLTAGACVSWYVRTFIDAGVDCPAYAVYVNGIVPGSKGWPKDKPRVACIFERQPGDMKLAPRKRIKPMPSAMRSRIFARSPSRHATVSGKVSSGLR